MSTIKSEGSIASYSIGFALSLVFTINAYLAVTNHLLEGWGLIWLISGFAMLQLLVQLTFFLHLSHKPEKRWNAVAYYFMLLVVGIVIFGSIWIMRNLDYHHTLSPQDSETFIMSDEGIDK